jgi:hypothetical protein
MSDPSPSEQAPPLLLAELLYETAPTITFPYLQERLSATLPSARLISRKESVGSFLIAHEDRMFEFKGGQKAPALTAIAVGNPVDPSKLDAAVRQTWDWPAARDLVARAKHHLIVTEMMARVFSPADRVEMFYSVLSLILEAAKPLCIHCHHAERIVDPTRLTRASGAASSTERMAAFLNVRLFRIENDPGAMVMDTRGLAALCLPDLQVHFRDLEPRKVAAALYSTGVYIYENGDCIQDGHTVQGLSADQKWRCQHEESLLPPKRAVLDIDPGEPFAAGKRRR